MIIDGNCLVRFMKISRHKSILESFRAFVELLATDLTVRVR